MKIVIVGRHFEDAGRSDSIIVDLDLCTTPDELIFRDEIEKSLLNMRSNVWYYNLYDATKESKDIITGSNSTSFRKLNFVTGETEVSGTIQYGPVIFI